MRRCSWSLAGLGAIAGCQLVYPLEVEETARCSTSAHAFVDSLQERDPIWEALGSLGATQTNDSNGLQLTLPAAGSFSILRSRNFFDLRESSFEVEVEPVAVTADDTIGLALLATDFNPANSAGRTLELRRTEDQMVAMYAVDNDEFRLRELPFDPVAHRFWRIARDGDNVRWSVSEDGNTFTLLAEFELDIAFVRPTLLATRNDDSTTPFTATFRGLNQNVAREPVCPAAGLIDPFEAELDRITWGRSGPLHENNCAFATADGKASVAFTASPHACELGTSGIFDLLATPITIEVEANALDSQQFKFDVVTMDDRSGRFVIDGSKFRAATREGIVDTAITTDISYDPIVHRFWRFTAVEEDGLEQLEWQTSEDGSRFTFFAKVATLIGLDRVRFRAFAIDSTATSTLQSSFSLLGVNAP